MEAKGEPFFFERNVGNRIFQHITFLNSADRETGAEAAGGQSLQTFIEPQDDISASILGKLC